MAFIPGTVLLLPNAQQIYVSSLRTHFVCETTKTIVKPAVVSE